MEHEHMSSKSLSADLSCCLQAIEACWTGLMPGEGKAGQPALMYENCNNRSNVLPGLGLPFHTLRR